MAKTAQSIHTDIENEDNPDLYLSVCLQLKRLRRKKLKPEILKAEVDAHLIHIHEKVCIW